MKLRDKIFPPTTSYTLSKEDNNIRHSSIRENYFPSTVAFVDRFPISQQATIVEKLDNGEFNIHCK